MTLKLILVIVVALGGTEAMGWTSIIPTVDVLWKFLTEPEPVVGAMIWQMGALFDSKARAYRPPFFVAHMDVALRSIRAAVNDPKHELSQFAEDFFVHHLGTFDDELGRIEARHTPFNHGCIAVMRAPARLSTENSESSHGSELVQPGQE